MDPVYRSNGHMYCTNNHAAVEHQNQVGAEWWARLVSHCRGSLGRQLKIGTFIQMREKTAFMIEHFETKSYQSDCAVCKDIADSADGARLGASLDALSIGDGD